MIFNTVSAKLDVYERTAGRIIHRAKVILLNW